MRIGNERSLHTEARQACTLPLMLSAECGGKLNRCLTDVSLPETRGFRMFGRREQIQTDTLPDSA